MLQQICEEVCNYFVKAVYEGNFEISNGMISLPLLDGQRFLIKGSVLNDGMYTYHDTYIGNDDDTEAVGLQDETWAGTICGLNVPPALKTLSCEVLAWVEANGESLNSPYTSESVLGVYSYTKASGGHGAGGSVGWMDVFADKLKRWRKVNFD